MFGGAPPARFEFLGVYVVLLMLGGPERWFTNQYLLNCNIYRVCTYTIIQFVEYKVFKSYFTNIFLSYIARRGLNA